MCMKITTESDDLRQHGSDLLFEFVEREGGHGSIIPVSALARDEGV